MCEDLLTINFRLKNENLKLKAERDTYKLLTVLALAGMLAMTVGFLIALRG